MKTGLVLEGGAMRGIYTAGVLDVFLEEGIYVDGVLGVSAGAIHGCSYVSGQKGRSIRYYKKYCRHPQFMGLFSLLTTGNIVGEKFCYEKIPQTLDPFDREAFLKSPMKYYVTCTNLNTGMAEYILCDDLGRKEQLDALRASASMPLVSKIVRLNGQLYLDGGASDSIPVAAMGRLGYEKRIVVLTQVKEYCKKPASLTLPNIRYRSYPNFVKSIEKRHIVYNEERKLIDKLEQEGKVLAIYPSKELHIGRLEKDPKRIQMMYDLGRHDALEKLDEIRAFLRHLADSGDN